MLEIPVTPVGAASHMEKRVAGTAKLSLLAGKNSHGTADRRVRIAGALDNCIRDKGYAATTLTDIAVRAAMSPSHIRYYFDGKEEILEFYLEATCGKIIREISAISRDTPTQWLDDFTAYFFGNPAATREAIAVVVEAFASATHNPRLARVKSRYDDFIRKTFLEFFRWTGCGDGMTPAEAAYMAAALESGMKFNAVSQKDFSREKAAKVFLTEMRRMAGIRDSKR